MNIREPLRKLGNVDMNALRDCVLGLDDQTWLLNEQRQQNYDVHRQTRSVVMVFCDGPVNELEVTRSDGWDALADAALPLMRSIVETHYEPGGLVIRAMAASLLPGGRIKSHFDSHPTFRRSHRIHVPITTNPRVRFMIDGKPFQLEVGEAYEINNQLTHSVMNSGTQERITFIFDYMPRTEIGSAVR